MAKNTSSAASVAAKIDKLRKEGYVVLPVTKVFDGKTMGSNWDDVLNKEMLRGVVTDGNGKPLASNGATFVPRSDERFDGVERIGTKKLGWMAWGMGNALPNRIALLASLLPYTAVGLRFNTETAFGLGPQATYHYVKMVNGRLTEEDVPYGDAGVLLLADLNEARGTESEKECQQLYDDWKRTNDELTEFLANNNLDDVMLHLLNDLVYYNICFPEIQLSRGTADEASNWAPKAVGLGYYEAHETRLERMDSYGRINYVYCSTHWMDSKTYDAQSLEVVAIPALDPNHPARSLEKAVRDNRMRGGARSLKNRNTRYVLPCSFPTPGKPYYPAVPWHSIFNGDLYAYCSTIVSDRYARKRNNNIIGRIVYVHTEYLDRLFTQGNNGQGCTTDEERNAMRDKLWTEINKFLSNPDNAGKSLLSFTFTGSDGKPTDAFRVVDIPAAKKEDAEANKTELQEISSVILFALGVNPALIGVVPGSSGMGGGTYQRELYLLKQAQLAPMQRLALRALDTISRFNKWDSRLVWKTKNVVLTTLDRSKTGLAEDER